MASSALGLNDDEFWVTLPSNSSASAYPKNGPSSYKVRLRKPIDLSARGGEWEVALLSTQYTHCWYNFRQDCNIRFLVKLPDTGLSKTSSSGDASGRSRSASAGSAGRIVGGSKKEDDGARSSAEIFYREVPFGGHPDFEDHDHFITSFRESNQHGIDEDWVYHKVTLRRAYFSTIYDLGKEISRLFERAFHRHDMQLTIHHDYETGRISCAVNRGKVAILLDDTYLAGVLGMETEKVIDSEYVNKRNVKLYLLKTDGVRAPRLDVVNSFYVYSDIAKYQAVGDTEAPLLGIVPVQGEPGNRLYWSFNPLCYLPVNRSYISEIEILLCTEDGERVLFASASDNVVCSLRFRKSRRSHQLLY